MKQIPLSQGKFALVDDEDYDYLMQWKWNFNAQGYAVRGVRMHRIINSTPENMIVDHINGDKLDNRKENLRNCTNAQNACNKRKITLNHSSIYRGVSWHKLSKKWTAQIQISRKRVHIGRYDTEIEAAMAYNDFAVHYHGEYATLNVIKNDS
jgi:hypothetical protein